MVTHSFLCKDVPKALFSAAFIFLFTVFSSVLHAAGFTDSHDDGNPLTNPSGSGWTSQGTRTWSEVSGQIIAQNNVNAIGQLVNNYNCSNNGTFVVVIKANSDWESNNGGILFRWTSASSFYFVSLYRGDGNPNNKNGYIYWGKDTVTGTQQGTGFAMPQVCTLKVECNGSEFKIYVNDTLRLTKIDASHSSGKVGYGYTWQWTGTHVNWLECKWTDSGTDPAVITTHPKSDTVNIGDPVSFIVAATGTAPIGYQWQTDTGGAWANIASATGTMYSIASATLAHTGNYRAVASNVNGADTSNAAKLSVLFIVPLITTHPKSDTVNIGDPASFTIAAIGSPQLSYKWQKKQGSGSWTDIGGATSTAYSIASVGLTDTGNYRGIASNPYGADTSDSARLSVFLIAPTITLQPKPDTAHVGSTASFSVTAAGSPAPSFQWQKRQGAGAWAAISGATGAAYTKANVVFADTGYYRAVAVNIAGTDTSDSAYLLVYDTTMNLILQHPKSDTVLAGDTVQFSITPVSGLVLKFQWQKRTGTGGTPGNITGATSAAYRFAAQAGDNNTFYRCIVTYGPQQQSSNFGMLMIGTPPAVQNQFASDTVLAAGKNLTLTGTATGFPAPTLAWYVKHPASSSPVAKGTGNSLQVTGLTKADSGSFYFTAINTFGSKNSDSLFTHVLAPVTIATDLSPVYYAMQGGPVNFSINAGGDPVLSYQWYRNGVPVTGPTGNSYLINSVDSAIHHGNTIFCIVSNRHPAFPNIPVSADTTVVCTLRISKLYNPFKLKVERVDIHNTTQVRMKLYSDVNISNFPTTANPLTPWADSVWVMYRTMGYAASSDLAKIVRFSINSIKSAAPDSLKSVVTVGALPNPNDSLYWFNYSVLWHIPSKPDSLPRPYISSNKVFMIDTSASPNPLVLHGEYKMKSDTALVIINNINALSAAMDSMVVVQCSKYQNFNPLILNDSLPVSQLTGSGDRDTIVMARIGTLPLERDTVYCRWQIRARNSTLSRLLDTNFTIGWDRPEYAGTLDARSTAHGDKIQLSWTAPQPGTDSIRIWWDKSPIPLIHNPSLAVSHAFYPSPQTATVDTIENLANKTLYYFGLQIKKDDFWSKITVLSSDTATTAAGDTTIPPNRIKIDSTRFDADRNSIVVYWHLNLATMPSGQSYQCGVTYTLAPTVNPDNKPLSFSPINQNGNSTELVLYPEITFDTSYTVGLWVRGFGGPLGSTPASKPTDSSTAKVAIPSFTWQEVNIFPASDTVYAANKKILLVKIGGFTHLDTVRAHNPGSLPSGFLDAGGVSFYFQQKNPGNVQPFMLGLKYGALPAGAGAKDIGIYQLKNGQLYLFHDFFVRDSVAWTQVIPADFAYPFAVLADVQKPVVSVKSPYDTVSPGTTIPVYFSVTDNIANVRWTFKYGRGDMAYTFSKDGYATTGGDTTTNINFIDNSAISPQYGARAVIIASDGVHKDTANVSKCVWNRPGEQFQIPALAWVPLRTACGLEKQSLAIVLDQSLPAPDPWKYDVYTCRLYRWYSTDTHRANAWLEYADSVKNVFDLVPGKLIWCKMADSQNVSFGPGVTMSLKEPCEIELKPKDWTDICLPYQFPVLLRDVLEATAPWYDSLVVCRWVKDSNSYAGDYLYVSPIDTITAVKDTLKPGQGQDGYTIYNRYSRPVTLKIPPISLPLSAYAREHYGSAPNRSADRWEVNLRWRESGTGSACFKKIICSYKKGAGPDIYGPLPPTMNRIQAGICDLSKKSIYGWSLKTVADKNGGFVYEISFCNGTGNSVAIEYYLDNLNSLPAGMKARMFDARGAACGEALCGKPITVHVAAGSSAEYILAIGTEGYFGQVLAGLFMPFKFIKAYPNPFNGLLHINYRVPFGVKQVEFLLYNVQGKMLRKGLIRKNGGAGDHIYTIETGKKQLPAGIYIVRLTAKNSAGKIIFGGEKMVTCVR